MMNQSLTEFECSTGVIAQYQWNCSEPDQSGERYIPGISREYPRSVLTTETVGGAIYIFRVQNLTADCIDYGDVIGFYFCYQYSTVTEEPVFNWVVLILEETNNVFTITRSIAIESRPNSSSTAECERPAEQTIRCCDRDYVGSFNLQMNDFTFGVTKSVQGNTHGATLLAFHQSLPEYSVHTQSISNAGQRITLSVGNTIPQQGVGNELGLRMLWFIIGSDIATNESITPSEASDISTISTTVTATLGRGSDSSEAVTSTGRGSDSNVNQQSRVQADVGVVVGSVIGAVVVITLLSAVIVLTLALVHLARKYKSIVTKGRLQGTTIAVAQNTYTLDMEMNSNDAYALSIIRLDSMESNAAYGGVNQDSNNNVYEIIKSIDRPDEGITEARDSIESHQNEEDFTGGTVYEYIDEDDR